MVRINEVSTYQKDGPLLQVSGEAGDEPRLDLQL